MKTPPGRLQVLFSFREPSTESNPYVRLLTDSLGPSVGITYFSWRRALASRYDVFHVHWPETLLRARTPLRRVTATGLLLLLVLRLRLTRIAVVRTLHNVSPHESGTRVERVVLDLLDGLTTTWIVHNTDESVDDLALPRASIVSVPHGHFRDWYEPWRDRRRRIEPGSVLVFGQIRPYKGVEGLLEVADTFTSDDGISILIAGAAADHNLRRGIEAHAASNPFVRAQLRFMSDSELTALIETHQLAVLPYERMLNSGAVLAALSLDRPVLIPRSDINEALAREVGEEWVLLYDPPLTAGALRQAVAATSARMDGRPDLGGRGWDAVASEHVSAYRRTSRPVPRRRRAQGRAARGRTSGDAVDTRGIG